MNVTIYEDFLLGQCANCTLVLKDTSSKIMKINVSKSSKMTESESTDLISNLDAISYLCGVPRQKFVEKLILYLQQVYENEHILHPIPERNSNISECFETCDLALCTKCSLIVTEMYRIQKIFEQSSDENSLIAKTVMKERFHIVSKVKEEILYPNQHDGAQCDHLESFCNEENSCSQSFNELNKIKSEDLSLDTNDNEYTLSWNETQSDDARNSGSEKDKRTKRTKSKAAAACSYDSQDPNKKQLEIDEKFADSDNDNGSEILGLSFNEQEDYIHDLNHSSSTQNSPSNKSKNSRVTVKRQRSKRSEKTYIAIPLKREVGEVQRYKYACKTCGKVFVAISTLHNHQIHHSTNEFEEYPDEVLGPPFLCPICSADYTSFYILKVHCIRQHKLRIHSVNAKPRHRMPADSEELPVTDTNHFLASEQQRMQIQSSNDANEVYKSAQNFNVIECSTNICNESFKDVTHMKKPPKIESSTKSKTAPRSNIVPLKELKIVIPKLDCSAPNTTVMQKTNPNVNRNRKVGNIKAKRNPTRLRLNASEQAFITIPIKRQQGEVQRYNYSCKICGKIFNSTVTANTHQIVHFSEKLDIHQGRISGPPYQCPKCEKCYVSMSSIKSHCISHHKLQLSDTFRRLNETVEESERDSAEQIEMIFCAEPYFCRSCNVGFKTRGSIICHNRLSHNSIEQYDCKWCSDAFETTALLVLHLSEVHKEYAEPETNHDRHRCNDCGQVLSRVSMWLHKREKKHNSFTSICSLCKEEFTSLSKFYIHRHTKHQTERNRLSYIHHSKVIKENYSCPFCDEIFSTVMEVKNHKLTHPSEERMYKCRHCPRTFSYGHQLRYHKSMVHSNEPTEFQCEKCGDKIRGIKAYRKHRIRHAEIDRGYQSSCTMCGKTFKNSISLRRHHYNTCNSKEFLQCQLCAFKTKRKDGMKRHVSTKHRKA